MLSDRWLAAFHAAEMTLRSVSFGLVDECHDRAADDVLPDAAGQPAEREFERDRHHRVGVEGLWEREQQPHAETVSESLSDARSPAHEAEYVCENKRPIQADEVDDLHVRHHLVVRAPELGRGFVNGPEQYTVRDEVKGMEHDEHRRSGSKKILFFMLLLLLDLRRDSATSRASFDRSMYMRGRKTPRADGLRACRKWLARRRRCVRIAKAIHAGPGYQKILSHRCSLRSWSLVVWLRAGRHSGPAQHRPMHGGRPRLARNRLQRPLLC